MTRKIPWFRVMVEGVVIVVSILLAFGIDAWWDSRGEARQERALLEGLADDLEATAALLAQARQAHESVEQAGRELLSFGEIGIVPDSARARVDTLISGHFWRFVFDPPMGTVESIVRSGKIDLLGNRRLVARLTQWSPLVDQLRFEEVDRRTHFNERLLPYLSARLDIEDLDKGFPKHLDEYPWLQQPTTAYLLLSDRAFLNILYMHWVLSVNILRDLDDVETAFEEIRSLVDSELRH